MTELRTEGQQHLTEKAQMIEDAKRLAEALRHNSQEIKFTKLKEAYPELSDQEINNLIQ